MERTKSKRKEQIKKILRKILILLIVILIILILIEKRYIIFIFFIIANLIFAFLKRFFHGINKYLYGIEIVMFSTIIISYNFGSIIGSFMGVFLMALNYIAEKRFSKYFIITLPLYFTIGYTAYFFKNFDIVFIGIIYTILYNLISTIISIKMGARKTGLIVFNIINIVFNSILFIFFGRMLI